MSPRPSAYKNGARSKTMGGLFEVPHGQQGHSRPENISRRKKGAYLFFFDWPLVVLLRRKEDVLRVEANSPNL